MCKYVVLCDTEKEILPYLPQLMQYLMEAVVNSPNKRAQELAISSISAAGEITTIVIPVIYVYYCYKCYIIIN